MNGPWKKKHGFLIDGAPAISKINDLYLSSDELSLKNKTHDFLTLRFLYIGFSTKGALLLLLLWSA